MSDGVICGAPAGRCIRRTAREKDEKRPSVGDRTPSLAGEKKPESRRTVRDTRHYFFCSSVATKVLTEVGAMEPVAANDLSERAAVTVPFVLAAHRLDVASEVSYAECQQPDATLEK